LNSPLLHCKGAPRIFASPSHGIHHLTQEELNSLTAGATPKNSKLQSKIVLPFIEKEEKSSRFRRSQGDFDVNQFARDHFNGGMQQAENLKYRWKKQYAI
jgi:hypothetical protein